MTMEIIAGIAVVLFAILIFFIIRTLISVNRTIQHVDFTIVKMEMRMKSIDPILRSISNLGEIGEEKTAHLKEECRKRSLYEERVNHQRFQEDSVKGDLAEWVLLSANLATKFFKRR